MGHGKPHSRWRIGSGPSNLGINLADICRLTIVKVHSSPLCGGKVLKSWRMQNKKAEHISILFSINQQKKLTRKYLSRMHWLVQAIETEIEQINLRELSICYGGASVWKVNNKHLCVQQHLSLNSFLKCLFPYLHFIQLQSEMKRFVNSHLISTVHRLKECSIVRATSFGLSLTLMELYDLFLYSLTSYGIWQTALRKRLRFSPITLCIANRCKANTV